MRQIQQVTDAYEYCRQVTQQASKTFYWGSIFLPLQKRQAIWAVYAFCRMVDDIVDEVIGGTRVGHLPGASSPARAIDEWRRALERLYQYGETHGEFILFAWQHMLELYPVPIEPAMELLDGIEMDLNVKRYQTFDELALYCYRVAGTVGLLTSPIFGYNDEAALAHAVDLGIALQLTNILRDIGEDAGRDRIYIPQVEMARFGYRESDLLDGVVNDAFRNLLGFQIERAEEYYHRGFPGIAMLEPDCQLAVDLSGTLYRRILERISANDFDVFTHRASVPLLTKLMTASVHWFMQQFKTHAKCVYTS